MDAIRSAGKLAFHIIGDTGGVRSPIPQQIVASHMEADSHASQPAAAFLYLVGDLVYYYGQPGEYYAQFFEPYVQYPAPIFAIPGNHDGDVLDASSPASLTAFIQTFCATTREPTSLSGDAVRDSMTQPNVYWTLETPFATIVGLYTNVPEGGSLDSEQIAWLHSELRNAPADRGLILTTHHPVYSGDRYHGGSEYMEEQLDLAIQKAGRSPDVVFSGHVHNYQRYARTIGDRRVPYLVVGAGGYWNLHQMQTHMGDVPRTPMVVPGVDALTLESYCDDRHGFMRGELSNGLLRARYFTVPRPHESWKAPAVLFDDFTVQLGQLAVTPPLPPLQETIVVSAPPEQPAAPDAGQPAEEPPVVVAEPELAVPRTSFGSP